MTDQTPQTTTEPVERESAHDAARRLFSAQYPGRPFDGIRDRSKISWFVASYEELADQTTTPQPLAIGLDREVRERIEKRIAEIDAHVARYPNSLDRNPATHAADLRSLLALAAPADGYVLVPVEPTEAMIEAGRGAASFYVATYEEGITPIEPVAAIVYRAMIAACLPAAPTGGRS